MIDPSLPCWPSQKLHFTFISNPLLASDVAAKTPQGSGLATHQRGMTEYTYHLDSFRSVTMFYPVLGIGNQILTSYIQLVGSLGSGANEDARGFGSRKFPASARSENPGTHLGNSLTPKTLHLGETFRL